MLNICSFEQSISEGITKNALGTSSWSSWLCVHVRVVNSIPRCVVELHESCPSCYTVFSCSFNGAVLSSSHHQAAWHCDGQAHLHRHGVCTARRGKSWRQESCLELSRLLVSVCGFMHVALCLVAWLLVGARFEDTSDNSCELLLSDQFSLVIPGIEESCSQVCSTLVYGSVLKQTF